MHQLVALVEAKLVPANGAFAALSWICFDNLSFERLRGYWVHHEPNRLDPWMGDLKRVCEKADVKLHHCESWVTGMEELSQDAYCCSVFRRYETPLDSAPVIPEKEE